MPHNAGTYRQGSAGQEVWGAIHGDRVVPVGQCTAEKKHTLGVGDARTKLDRRLLDTIDDIDRVPATRKGSATNDPTNAHTHVDGSRCSLVDTGSDLQIM